MKRCSSFKVLIWIFVLAVFFFVAGCNEVDGLSIVANMAAVEIGCEIKQSGDTEADQALRDLYIYADSGEIPQSAIDTVNKHLSRHLSTRPTLPIQLASLAALLGAKVDPENNKVLGVVEVPPQVLNSVAIGYNAGYDNCVIQLE